ncbi:hypothetical protein TK49_05875 [Ralstonia mannitolilytica]|nr:hypothetical protein TK49_05875 [Ralstonia mannitolilytica]
MIISLSKSFPNFCQLVSVFLMLFVEVIDELLQFVHHLIESIFVLQGNKFVDSVCDCSFNTQSTLTT